MKTSNEINEIASALSKAQGEMLGAAKAQNNPFFKSKYSDLSEVMAAIRIPFANNGLSFVQGAEFDENKIAVTTKIMHSSGQWIEATTTLPPTKNDAQGYGSAITYAKRYGLQALAGVPSVDDDGQAAVQHQATPKPKTKEKPMMPINGNVFVNAVSAYIRDGNLDAVEKRYTIPTNIRQAIIDKAGEKQNEAS